MIDVEYKYYSSVHGRAVQRHGTVAFIGCVKLAAGFQWDVDLVVRVPASEVARHLMAYRASVAGGDLVERTREEFEAQLAAERAKLDEAGAALGRVPDVVAEPAEESAEPEPDKPRRRRGS